MIVIGGLSFHSVFGVELEFYTEGIRKEHSFLNGIKNEIAPLGFSCEREGSLNQYEVKSVCYKSSKSLISNFELVKQLLTEVALKFDGDVCFKSKPYLDRAGSALNVHVNLVNSNNNNLFSSRKEKYTDCLIYSIGGLCAMMKEHMPFFAPDGESYLRFKYPDIYTPTTVSWGVNNRTSAIRIPHFGKDFERCRIEHRVPGADCNLKKVLTAIIEGITFGIENRILPPNRVYGIASDHQYEMESLI